jgi:hypothetical protein
VGGSLGRYDFLNSAARILTDVWGQSKCHKASPQKLPEMNMVPPLSFIDNDPRRLSLEVPPEPGGQGESVSPRPPTLVSGFLDSRGTWRVTGIL